MSYDEAMLQVVLFGGYILDVGYLSGTWTWDGTNWTEKAPSNHPSVRVEHAMVYDATHGQTVLFGGYDGGGLGDTWVWDGTNWAEKAHVSRIMAQLHCCTQETRCDGSYRADVPVVPGATTAGCQRPRP